MGADVRLADLLSATARDLCELLRADACAISRVVGATPTRRGGADSLGASD